MTIEHHRQDLREQLERGELALFIGADLPQAVTGLPGRTNLAAMLAKRLALTGPLPPWSEVAARYEASMGRHALVSWLRDQLPITGKATQPFHQRLVELAEKHSAKTFITTAYDSLLALAFEQAGVARDGVLRDNDLRFADPTTPTLIWLYGKVEQVDSLVITEQDHWDLLRDRDREEVIAEVKRALRRNTILFVGYDLSDPDFRFLFNEVADSRFARLAYAAWPGLPETDVRLWRDRGIVILNQDALGILGGDLLASPMPDDVTASTLPPKTARPESSPPPHRKHARVHFKLQLGRLAGLEFEVRAFETPMGESRATSRLPYEQDDLVAILKALPAGSLEAAKLTSNQADRLRDLGLLSNPRLVPDFHEQVGRALYQSLFPEDIGAAFKMAWNQVRPQRGSVSLQLRFDEDAVALARYPWELLHDHRRHLLPGGAIELTRYISYPEAPTTLPVEPPLRVLYVESRPSDLVPLPERDEQTAVRAVLESLVQKGLLVLEDLSSPTYSALIDRIESAQDHILHFDGHGMVARYCPDCGARNYPHHMTCQQTGCGHPLEGVTALGYLAFERDDAGRRVDWVDSKALEHLLYGSAVRLAVLSACRGSEVRGETLFGGVGPALIQAGVPAVVAMQVPVTVSATIDFMRGFYGTLARFEPLPAAMTSGRRRLFRGSEWFIPTLYLRGADDEGRLFVE